MTASPPGEALGAPRASAHLPPQERHRAIPNGVTITDHGGAHLLRAMPANYHLSEQYRYRAVPNGVTITTQLSCELSAGIADKLSFICFLHRKTCRNLRLTKFKPLDGLGISFSLPTITFVINQTTTSDRHRLCLEGTLLIDGQQSAFSLVLLDEI